MAVIPSLFETGLTEGLADLELDTENSQSSTCMLGLKVYATIPSLGNFITNE